MLTFEGGSLAGWIYVDVTSDDIGGYVQRAKAEVSGRLQLKPGHHLKWTGQYEFLERIPGTTVAHDRGDEHRGAHPADARR